MNNVVQNFFRIEIVVIIMIIIVIIKRDK